MINPYSSVNAVRDGIILKHCSGCRSTWSGVQPEADATDEL